MTEFYLKIKLLSDALVGSGESFGANIDSDIYFDDFGLPICCQAINLVVPVRVLLLKSF